MLLKTQKRLKAAGGALRLTDWGVMRAQGEEAAKFLHGQLTQDAQADHRHDLAQLHAIDVDRPWLRSTFLRGVRAIILARTLIGALVLVPLAIKRKAFEALSLAVPAVIDATMLAFQAPPAGTVEDRWAIYTSGYVARLVEKVEKILAAEPAVQDVADVVVGIAVHSEIVYFASSVFPEVSPRPPPENPVSRPPAAASRTRTAYRATSSRRVRRASSVPPRRTTGACGA